MTETIEEILAREKAECLAQVVGEVLGEKVTRGQLMEAFRKVEPKPNWKTAINAVVVVENDRELFMIHEAIVFFCGCRATATFLGRKRYRFKAVGYYEAVGP